MVKLVNRAKMTTPTTGTGTITLGSASSGYQTFAAAGIVAGDVVRYVIEDSGNWEIGVGTYLTPLRSPPSLTRTPSESSSGGAAITLSGNATVFVSTAAADLQELVAFSETFVLPAADGTSGQALTTNGAGALGFSTIKPGATGGGSNAVFVENDQTVTTSYTITTGKNAMSAGPITIAAGITVTVPAGSVWTVV